MSKQHVSLFKFWCKTFADTHRPIASFITDHQCGSLLTSCCLLWITVLISKFRNFIHLTCNIWILSVELMDVFRFSSGWRLQYQVIKNQVTRGRGVTALHSYNSRCLDGGLWLRKCFAPLLCYHSLLAPAKTAPAYIFNTFNTDGKIETLKYTGFQMEMNIITDQLCSIYNCCWMEPIFGPYFLDLCPCCQRLSVNIRNYEIY